MGSLRNTEQVIFTFHRAYSRRTGSLASALRYAVHSLCIIKGCSKSQLLDEANLARGMTVRCRGIHAGDTRGCPGDRRRVRPEYR
jgi:hypothetical protein